MFFSISLFSLISLSLSLSLSLSFSIPVLCPVLSYPVLSSPLFLHPRSSPLLCFSLVYSPIPFPIPSPPLPSPPLPHPTPTPPPPHSHPTVERGSLGSVSTNQRVLNLLRDVLPVRRVPLHAVLVSAGAHRRELAQPARSRGRGEGQRSSLRLVCL